MNNFNMRRALKTPTLRMNTGGEMPMNTTPMSPQDSAAFGNMPNTMVSMQSAPAPAAPAPSPTANKLGPADYNLPGNTFSPMATPTLSLREGGEVSPWSLKGMANTVSKAMTKSPEEVAKAQALAEYKARAAQARTPAPVAQPVRETAAPMGSQSVMARREAAAGLRNGGPPPTMPNANKGGWVPGEGEGDKTRALLEKDEFVVSKDMLEAQPALRQHLHDLRGNVLAAKGMSVEEADAESVKDGTLRANDGGAARFRSRVDAKLAAKYAAQPAPTGIVEPVQKTVPNTAMGQAFANAKNERVGMVEPKLPPKALAAPDLGLDNSPYRGPLNFNPAPVPTAPNLTTSLGAAPAPPKPVVDLSAMNQPGVDSRNAQFAQRSPGKLDPHVNPFDAGAREAQILAARSKPWVPGTPAVPAGPALRAPLDFKMTEGDHKFRGTPTPATPHVNPNPGVVQVARGALKTGAQAMDPRGLFNKAVEAAPKVLGSTMGRISVTGVATVPGQLRVGEVLTNKHTTPMDVARQQGIEARRLAVTGVGATIGGVLGAPFGGPAGVAGGALAGGALANFADSEYQKRFNNDYDNQVTNKMVAGAARENASPVSWGKENNRQVSNINAPGGNLLRQEQVTPPAAAVDPRTEGITDAERLQSDALVNKAFGRKEKLGGEFNMNDGINTLRSSPTDMATANKAWAMAGRGIQASTDVKGGLVLSNSTGPEKMRYVGQDGKPTNNYEATEQFANGQTQLAAARASLRNPDGSTWSEKDNAIMAANLRDGVDQYRGTSRQPVDDAPKRGQFGYKNYMDRKQKDADRGALRENQALISADKAEDRKVTLRGHEVELERALAPAKLAAQQRERSAEIFRAADGDPNKAAALAASLGMPAKDYLDMAASLQAQESSKDTRDRANQEAGVKSFENSFPIGVNDKGEQMFDKALAKEAWDVAVRSVPKFATMGPEERAPHMKSVISNMRLTAQARGMQNKGLSSLIFPDHPAHAPLDVDSLASGEMDERGFWAGALRFGGEEWGNTLFTQPGGGRERNFGHASEVDRKWLIEAQKAAKAAKAQQGK